MTYTYTFDDLVIIQQLGSEHVDSFTGIEICKLNEEGWSVKDIHPFPASQRCYVILEKYEPEPEAEEEIYKQWNIAFPYYVELWD